LKPEVRDNNTNSDKRINNIKSQRSLQPEVSDSNNKDKNMNSINDKNSSQESQVSISKNAMARMRFVCIQCIDNHANESWCAAHNFTQLGESNHIAQLYHT
jgi:hypothetical protein